MDTDMDTIEMEETIDMDTDMDTKKSILKPTNLGCIFLFLSKLILKQYTIV